MNQALANLTMMIREQDFNLGFMISTNRLRLFFPAGPTEWATHSQLVAIQREDHNSRADFLNRISELLIQGEFKKAWPSVFRVDRGSEL